MESFLWVYSVNRKIDREKIFQNDESKMIKKIFQNSAYLLPDVLLDYFLDDVSGGNLN